MNTHHDGKLVVTPAPDAEESFFGYVLRLAIANGHKTPTAIFKQVQPGKNLSAYVTRETLIRLSDFTGHSVEKLETVRWHRWPDGAPNEKRKDSSTTVFTSLVGTLRTKMCPDCVAESGKTKYIWDVRLMVACSRHQKALIRRCQKCSKQLKWCRSKLDHCTCGHKFQGGHVVSPELSELMNLIQAHIAGKPVKESVAGFPLAELSQFTSVGLLRFLTQLGKAVDPSYYSEFPTTESGEKIARFLSRWPEGLFRHMDETLVDIDRRQEIDKGSIATHCRLLYIFASTNVERQKMKWMSDAIDVYIRRSWQCDDLRLVGLRAYREQALRISEECGIHPRTAMRWVRQGHCGASARLYGRSKTSIDFPHPLSDKEHITLAEAMAYMGIPRETFVSMGAQGMYETILVGKRVKISSRVVIALRERFIQLAGKQLEKLPADCTTIGQITRRKYDFSKEGRAALLKSIYDGNLVPEGILGAQIRDIVVKRHAMERAEQKRTFGIHQYPTFDEVRWELDIDYVLISNLIRQGHLTLACPAHGSKRVTRESLDVFKNEWMRVNTLAEQCGLNGTVRFTKALRGGGYPLLSVKRGTGANLQNFVRRVDASEIYQTRNSWLPAMYNLEIPAHMPLRSSSFCSANMVVPPS